MSNEAYADFLKSLIDAIPALVLVVDEDVNILEYNLAAGAFLGDDDRLAILKHRGGDVLHCIHARDVPEGCGAPFAATALSATPSTGLSGQSSFRRKITLELVYEGKTKEFFGLINASRRVSTARGWFCSSSRTSAISSRFIASCPSARSARRCGMTTSIGQNLKPISSKTGDCTSRMVSARPAEPRNRKSRERGTVHPFKELRHAVVRSVNDCRGSATPGLPDPRGRAGASWPAVTLAPAREVTLSGPLGESLQRGVARLAKPPYTEPWLRADVSFEISRIFTNYSGDVSGRFLELASLTSPPGRHSPPPLAPLLKTVARFQKPDGHFGGRWISPSRWRRTRRRFPCCGAMPACWWGW